MDGSQNSQSVLPVTPASPTQALSPGDRPPSTDTNNTGENNVQSLLDEFDPLSLDDSKTKEKQKDAAPKTKEQDTEGKQEDPEDTPETMDEKQPQHPVPAPAPEEKPDEGKPFDFQRFLNQMRHKSADPIARYLKSFLQEFNRRSWTSSEQVKIIGDFKQFICNKMAQCQPFSVLDEQEFDNALEGMEKLVMNRLYSQTFSPEIPDMKKSDDHEEDLIRDRVLEEKMRIWHWIEGRHLDLADRFLRNGDAFVKLASDELLKINHFRAPRDKIICILNCCKVIFGLLRQTNSEESADGFLPILIYVVIKAQPPELISNVNYIQRFRNPDKLGGESGYYLSSLIGAISFVETLDRTGLSITDAEFEENVDQSVKTISYDREKELMKHRKPLPQLQPQPQQNQGQQQHTELQPPSTPERRPSPNREANNSSPGMNASTVLMNSAGLLSAPLKSLGKLFEPEDEDDEAEPSQPQKDAKPNGMTPQELAARQASAEEEEARKIHEQEFESVCETLKQMFPLLDQDVIRDVLREKDSRVGAAVDACLVLVDQN